MSDSPRTVGFIGLGIMGLPMAGHFLDAGHPLIVNTRTRAKADPLVQRGAVWADSPADVVGGCDVVFICVTDTPDVEAVILGDRGILAGARKGAIIVDHSTISPSATGKMAEAVTGKGMRLLDAPISGGDIGARNATLSIMVGGDEDAFNEVKPLLDLLGKTITYCGRSGNGQLTKLTNQILVSINNMAVCEALTFARDNGLDPDKTIAAIGGGAAGSWQLTHLGPRMVAGDFAPGFMIDLQQKDLRLVRQSADEAHLHLPATEMVRAHFATAQKQGRGREGTQALFAIISANAK